MTKGKITIIMIISAVVAISITLIYKCLRHYRPVTITDEWGATITSSGEARSIDVYEMSGFPDRLLVQLPENLRQEYEWFGIDEHGVNLVHGVKTFPYRHHNRDTPFGILLNNPKLQDDWSVVWDGDNVQFGNDEFKISIKRK